MKLRASIKILIKHFIRKTKKSDWKVTVKPIVVYQKLLLKPMNFTI